MNKIILLVLLPFMVMAQNVWYVSKDDNPTRGTYDGRSWATAWNYFDSTSYTPQQNGINWAILGAGDTIYVSGGTDTVHYQGITNEGIVIAGGSGAGTTHTYAPGNPVVMCPAKYSGQTTGDWVNHIGDVYFTHRPTQSRIFSLMNKSNVKVTGFIFQDIRTSVTGNTAMVKLGNGDWGDSDSLIYFEDNIVIGQNRSSLLLMTSSKITVRNNVLYQPYGEHPDDCDIIGMNSGRGGHTIDGNLLHVGDAYMGLNQSADASITFTDTSMTDTRLNMVTDYHTGNGIYIDVGGWIAEPQSNNSNTIFIDNWRFPDIVRAAFYTLFATSTTIGWLDGSYTPDLYIGCTIVSSNAGTPTEMEVTDNDGTTFYGTGWSAGTPQPETYGFTITNYNTRPQDGRSYVVNTDAHRDGIQISNIGLGEYYGVPPYTTEMLTTTISNNIIVAPYWGTANWTSMVYASGTYCNQRYLVYNNIIANRMQRTSITNINIGQYSGDPFDNYVTSLYILNNTLINKGTGGGGNITAFNHDTLVIMNNLAINDTIVDRFYNLDDATNFASRIDDIDYNLYAEYAGISGTFATDNSNNYTYTSWLSLGSRNFDANSDTMNSVNITFSNKFDTLATGYYTTTGRDQGVDLSATYPFLAYDILGNPRSGTWDIGALEYQDGAVDSLPNVFAFTDITGATRSTAYTSNGVTLAGFDSAYAYASGNVYTINGGSDLTGYTRVFPNDVLRLKVTSSGSYSTAVSSTLNVGGRTDTYTVTTESAPITPSGGAVARGSNGLIWRDSTGKVIKVQ